MSNTIPLLTSASVKLDANGNGTVMLAPNVGQKWNLALASINTSTSVKIPQCSIYIGGQPTQDAFVDGTYTGNLNSTDAVSSYPIAFGQKVFAVWTGGDAGAIAQLTLRGTMDTP